MPEKELRKLREDRSLDHAPEAVERLEEQPESIRGVMKEYQLKGISFMARMVSDGVGCILADEMVTIPPCLPLSVLVHSSHAYPPL